MIGWLIEKVFALSALSWFLRSILVLCYSMLIMQCTYLDLDIAKPAVDPAATFKIKIV